MPRRYVTEVLPEEKQPIQTEVVAVEQKSESDFQTTVPDSIPTPETQKLNEELPPPKSPPLKRKALFVVDSIKNPLVEEVELDIPKIVVEEVAIPPTRRVRVMPQWEKTSAIPLRHELESEIGKRSRAVVRPVKPLLSNIPKPDPIPQVKRKKLDKFRKAYAHRPKGAFKKIILGLSIGLFIISLICITGLVAYGQLRGAVLSASDEIGMVFIGKRKISDLPALVTSLQQKRASFSLVQGLMPPFLNLETEEEKKQWGIVQQISQVAEVENGYIASTTDLIGQIVGGSGDVQSLIQDSQLRADQLSKEMGELYVEVRKQKSESKEISLQIMSDDGEKQLLDRRKGISTTQRVLSILPDILGVQKKKTYAVLVQNSLELRPTGGFLHVIALVTLDRGNVIDVQVKDAYEIDSQLKGRIDPPEDLKKYINETQWRFWDSNWSPDFPTTAKQVQFFLEKSQGISVDGVVGLNTLGLQHLLQASGPVTLESYNNEKVSAENLLERIQLKTELSFTPTKDVRRSYLADAVQSFFTQLQTAEKEKRVGVIRALGESFADDQSLLFSTDAQLEQKIQALGWGGEVVSPPCPAQFLGKSCFVDTLYVVDSNVGVNRVNYYLKKTSSHSVILNNEVAAHSVTLNYTNMAQTTQWPAGSYKNYIRAYIPSFATVTSILVDDKPLGVQESTQVDMYGKKQVSFFLEVPPSKSTAVVLNYNTPLSAGNAFVYALFVQRQAGIEDYPTSISINVQPPLVPRVVAPQAAVSANLIQFDEVFNEDKYMAVEVSP